MSTDLLQDATPEAEASTLPPAEAQHHAEPLADPLADPLDDSDGDDVQFYLAGVPPFPG